MQPDNERFIKFTDLVFNSIEISSEQFSHDFFENKIPLGREYIVVFLMQYLGCILARVFEGNAVYSDILIQEARDQELLAKSLLNLINTRPHNLYEEDWQRLTQIGEERIAQIRKLYTTLISMGRTFNQELTKTISSDQDIQRILPEQYEKKFSDLAQDFHEILWKHYIKLIGHYINAAYVNEEKIGIRDLFRYLTDVLLLVLLMLAQESSYYQKRFVVTLRKTLEDIIQKWKRPITDIYLD
jgi:hypothetical protein